MSVVEPIYLKDKTYMKQLKRKLLLSFVTILTFTVGLDVFRISNYELLQFWTRQDNYKLFYSGKSYEDFSVYRSLDGKLFVTINEPRPNGSFWTWHYIIRPKESTAEVAFQGELVDWQGKYACDTLHKSKDKLVFSGSDNAPKHRLYICSSGNCPEVRVADNYVEFPSIEYKENGVMIRISW